MESSGSVGGGGTTTTIVQEGMVEMREMDWTDVIGELTDLRTCPSMATRRYQRGPLGSRWRERSLVVV
jgi:hypothetical protein